MKVIFKKLRWKNFLSTGEMFTEIQLDRTPTTLITGKMGSGKSSITDCFTYVLFGKALRKIVKGKMINRKNQRGLVVEIEFSIGLDEYLVRRTMKPDNFEIIKNGEPIPQDAKAADYQNRLEGIIGCDYNLFIQTVIISKTRYTPFMQLDANARREFVETVLGLSVFGLMSKIHKKNIDTLKDSVDEKKSQYTVLKERVSQCEKSVTRVHDLIQSSTVEKVEFINSQIDTKKEQLSLINKEIKNLTDSLFIDSDGSVEKHKKLLTIDGQLKTKLSDQKNKLKSLDATDMCGACGQKITDEHIEKHRASYSTMITKLSDAIVDITQKISDILPTIDKINGNVAIKNNIQSQRRLTQDIERDIKALEKSKSEVTVDNTQLDEVKVQLETARNSFAKVSTEMGVLQTEVEYAIIVQSMLKDGGIKASIIDKSIPLINYTINQNISKFGFFINFTLDKEFNETIKVSGIDELSYYNFSEGEKLRIDLAILMAWRDIMALQNNMSSNVIIFDETIDASMDADGAHVFSMMLNELKDANIFIITHTPEKIENIARSNISFEIVDGYSHIKLN